MEEKDFLIEEFNSETEVKRSSFMLKLDQVKKDWVIYVMLIPVVLFFFLFRYLPMSSIFIAFKTGDINNFTHAGLINFNNIFFGVHAERFWMAFRNTFTLSAYGLFFGFPIPIVIALMFSEIKSEGYRAFTQIISYLPKFISTVVITSIIIMVLAPGGTANSTSGILYQFLQWTGAIPEGSRMDILKDSPDYFRSIYIISGIWEGAGYGSIVYFAAIMAISPTNYEAARIDGANKLDQIRYVTLPGMAPTLTIMLILRIGEILSIGYEKILLLTNNSQGNVSQTAEVLTTFAINFGSLYANSAAPQYGVAAAADMFNSVIAMLLVLGANFIARKVSTTSLF